MSILPVALVIVLAQQGGTTFKPEAERPVSPEQQERFDACVAHLESVRLPEAERCYTSFHSELPGSPLADEALYDLALAIERQGDIDRASATRERLMRDYPRSPLAPEATRSLIALRTSSGDLDGAADLQLVYAKRYPRSTGASEALATAAEVFTAFGEHRRAIDAHRLMVRLYSRSDSMRADASRGAIPLSLAASGASDDEVRAAFDDASSLAARAGNDSAFLVALGGHADWLTSKQRTSKALALHERITSAYEALDDDRLNIVSAAAHDVVAQAYLARAHAKLDSLEEITDESVLASPGLARKRLRSNIKRAQAARELLSSALGAGVLVSQSDDVSSYGNVDNRYKALILFELGRVDELVLADVRTTKLREKKQRSYLEGRLDVESAEALEARARSFYETIVSGTRNGSLITDVTPKALDRLHSIDPQAYPKRALMPPEATTRHDSTQSVGFIELGERPTL